MRDPLRPGPGASDRPARTAVPDAAAWLRIDVEARALAGAWVRLTYRCGLLDRVTRPLLRAVGSGAPDMVLHAAPFGRATWLGRIPAGTTELLVSPGCPAFAIERVERASGRALGWALLRRSRVRWFFWMAAPLVGLRGASDIQVRRELTATPLHRYDAWRRAGTRPLDPAFDGEPRGEGPPCHVRFVAAAEGSLAPLETLLAAQTDPNWSLTAVGALDAAGPPRTRTVAGDAPPDSVVADLSDGDLLVPVAADDVLPAHAVAVLARAARDRPAAAGFTADADGLDRAGRFRDPVFHAGRDALALGRATGRPVFCAVRAEILRAAPGLRAADLLCPQKLLEALHGTRPFEPIRRVLLTRRDPSRAAPVRAAPPVPRGTHGGPPRATIVIPTRDRLDLLGRCVASLRDTGSLAGAEVVVVDNGSAKPETRAYLDGLAADRRFRVLRDDRPFNFPRLCNGGAALARAPMLVFLNNDTEARDALWLDALLTQAERAEVGAAGAKLLYANGTVQHAGVVVGIDGLAGHFERGLARDDPGVFGRLALPHAVSAVTAACLAVERRKFEAVGGFDEALAVDLNDIDLCLRLGARGWASMLVPAAVLIHHESASRGVSQDPDSLYEAEQARFRERWMEVIRDDPHFHPALSLDALEARLG